MANETGLLVTFASVILFVSIIGVYDLLARRQHRRKRERGKSA